ncbi:hypothetical protein EJV46_01015, partial [Roseococcus sp. SYP-B2431]|uniref:non-homologous end-joining DNA ligase LigD n=1 Tax=Roseococcus sp. SYP-B2431 TaxID=2496640 RepID=UPI001040C287
MIRERRASASRSAVSPAIAEDRLRRSATRGSCRPRYGALDGTGPRLHPIRPGLVGEVRADRPLTLIRCPQGRAKKCFFQKHDAGAFGDTVKQVAIREKNGTS